MYDPIIARWFNIDPLAEKRYNITPYHFCSNNSVNRIDPNGEDDYYTLAGMFLYRDNKETDYIMIREINRYAQLWNTTLLSDLFGKMQEYTDTRLIDMTLSAEAYSNIFTDILNREGYDTSLLHNGQVSIQIFAADDVHVIKKYNDPIRSRDYASMGKDDNNILTASIFGNAPDISGREVFGTVSNVQSILGDHELTGHKIKGWSSDTQTHYKVYEYQMRQRAWEKTTQRFKKINIENYKYYLRHERGH